MGGLLLLQLGKDFFRGAQIPGFFQRLAYVRASAARPPAGSGLQFPDLALVIAVR